MKHDHAQFTSVKDISQPMGLPVILIRRADQIYVGAARYERDSRRHDLQFHGDELKILVRLPDGDGYLQAKEMAMLDSIKGTTYLKRALEAAGLPMIYAGLASHAVPSVMSQVEDDLFIPGAARGLAPEKIFIERSSRNKVSGTGSFITLQAHLRYRSREALTAEQIRLLGSEV